jgi:hypothetical protein
MKRPKGPDLKMPELKAPAFLADLYYDLRDRRLLPLVLVAIAAVPFLLGGDPEKSGPPRIGPVPEGAANASQLMVVPATPGLRDYRKRLQGRSPKDPFGQPAASKTGLGGELGSKGNNGFEASKVTTSTTSTTSKTTSEGATTETTETTKSDNGVVTTETTTTTEESDSQEGGQSEPAEVPLSAFAIDVKIKQKTTQPDGVIINRTFERTKLLAPAALPDAKTQVVTYMGISPETRNPMFLVSDEVTSVFGEGKCLSGVRACQLLEVEKGMPTTFIFGPVADSYKITVTNVGPVTTSKPGAQRPSPQSFSK